MSGHRRVKALDYEDDESDDYDDGYQEEGEYAEGGGQDGTSPEDKEQLQQGLAKVRAALGDGYDVSDQAIQESLWYYYFDADKTIVYLKSMLPTAGVQSKSDRDRPEANSAGQVAKAEAGVAL